MNLGIWHFPSDTIWYKLCLTQLSLLGPWHDSLFCRCYLSIRYDTLLRPPGTSIISLLNSPNNCFCCRPPTLWDLQVLSAPFSSADLELPLPQLNNIIPRRCTLLKVSSFAALLKLYICIVNMLSVLISNPSSTLKFTYFAMTIMLLKVSLITMGKCSMLAIVSAFIFQWLQSVPRSTSGPTEQSLLKGSNLSVPARSNCMKVCHHYNHYLTGIRYPMGSQPSNCSSGSCIPPTLVFLQCNHQKRVRWKGVSDQDMYQNNHRGWSDCHCATERWLDQEHWKDCEIWRCTGHLLQSWESNVRLLHVHARQSIHTDIKAGQG